MPHIIEMPDVVSAWRTAATYVALHGQCDGLMVKIEAPAEPGSAAKLAREPKIAEPGAMSLNAVAATIFPREGPYWHVPPAQFFAHYAEAYRRMGNRHPGGWGTYFERFLSFGTSGENQLERLLQGLSTWGRNHRAAFVMHTSSMETDRPRPQGQPCLQYVQFGSTADGLACTAVYRSHDFCAKALGNYIGLGRLQRFLAMRAGLPVGALTCVSIHAFAGTSKRRLRELAA